MKAPSLLRVAAAAALLLPCVVLLGCASDGGTGYNRSNDSGSYQFRSSPSYMTAPSQRSDFGAGN